MENYQRLKTQGCDASSKSFSGKAHEYQGVRQALCDMRYARGHWWVGSPIFEKRLSAVDNCKIS